MLKAIETRYKGYRFRSRLEARWAVFFDALGIAWEYEKEGYDLGTTGWYLPDFWLPEVYDRQGKKGIWLELKGQKPTEQEYDFCELLATGSQQSATLFVGLPESYPDDTGYQWTAEDSFVGWDNYMRFHYCEHCKSVKIEFDNDYWDCFKCNAQTCIQSHPVVKQAAAQSFAARFEHGEQS